MPFAFSLNAIRCVKPLALTRNTSPPIGRSSELVAKQAVSSPQAATSQASKLFAARAGTDSGHVVNRSASVTC
eukprot:4981509-Pleurochrysis_carterae.AAC.4